MEVLYKYTMISADTTDLDPLDGIVRFSRQQSQRCINVTIEPDEQVEMTESFDVVLDETADLNEQIILTRRRASVIITNDDSKNPSLAGLL